jgi:two-component system OmpR family sensor kinase
MVESQPLLLELPTTPVRVDADARRLQQVLLNLIANALQHGRSSQGTVVRVRADADAALIEVIDHGPGIAPVEQHRIFERFYTAEHSGRGLGIGLYLTHAIVAAHGGTIQMARTQGGGTTFAVRLPRTPETP